VFFASTGPAHQSIFTILACPLVKIPVGGTKKTAGDFFDGPFPKFFSRTKEDRRGVMGYARPVEWNKRQGFCC
jgi:hypothetical protein